MRVRASTIHRTRKLNLGRDVGQGIPSLLIQEPHPMFVAGLVAIMFFPLLDSLVTRLDWIDKVSKLSCLGVVHSGERMKFRNQ